MGINQGNINNNKTMSSTTFETATYYKDVRFNVDSNVVTVTKVTELFQSDILNNVVIIKSREETPIYHESSEDDISKYPEIIKTLINHFWQSL